MNAAAVDPSALSGLSIRDLIDLRADRAPDQVFLVDPDSGAALTYADLQQRAAALAAHIEARGVKPGDSVAYALANGVPSALVILGTLYGGYLATAINLVAGRNAIAYALEHSAARLVFVEDSSEALLAEASKGLNHPAELLRVSGDLFRPGPAAAPTPAPEAATDGLLMYTSGTTGLPKGVLLTHRSLLAGGANTALAHQLTSADRTLCVLPLFHVNGLCVTLMGTLVSGGSVAIPRRFSVSAFWETMRDTGCTWFSVVPTQISYLLHDAEKRDHSGDGQQQIRFGRSASAPLAPDIQNAFEARFKIPIIETMGLTETAAQILSNPLPPGLRKKGSPGVAIGNEVIIADDKQREVPRGKEGEVLVRGANVMRGYRNNEAATRAAITEDGWLRTGDLGRMDEDSYVFITGRLKELIIKGGENIAPREVDEALYSHPDVVEAAAFARECRRYGQRVEAAVMLTKDSALTEGELIDLCQVRLGAFKTPERIHFMPELPKGPSGKIQRLKLAEMTPEHEG